MLSPSWKSNLIARSKEAAALLSAEGMASDLVSIGKTGFIFCIASRQQIEKVVYALFMKWDDVSSVVVMADETRRTVVVSFDVPEWVRDSHEHAGFDP